MTDQEQFDTGAAPRAPEGQLYLDLDGFEGPIDVLLALARGLGMRRKPEPVDRAIVERRIDTLFGGGGSNGA